MDTVICPRCKGKGKAQCEHCGGNGSTSWTCYRCNGTGHENPTRVEEVDKLIGRKCWDCGGTGYSYDQCSHCSGSGVEECPNCHGEGRVAGSTFANTARQYDKAETPKQGSVP